MSGSAAPAMSRGRTMVICALMVMLGPISLALYTPAMPTLAAEFATSPARLGTTITVYFFGYCMAQLVAGPLSDAYGRRPVAIGFFALYSLGSLGCLLSGTVGQLIAFRALQGVGAAAGPAISRALVRDQFEGAAAVRLMNLIGLMLAVGPAIAPTLGGQILALFGWHWIFLGMLLFGVAVLLLLCFATVETNRNRDPALLQPGRIVGSYSHLLASRAFMRPALMLGFSVGGIYVCTPLLPFVLITEVGLTPGQFGLVMLAQTGSYMAGSLVTARLLRTMSERNILVTGLAIVLLSALGFALLPRFFPPSLVVVMAPVAIWAFSVALLVPILTTQALAGFAHMAGTASALAGCLQIGAGLVGAALAGALFAEPLTALTTIVPMMAVLNLATYLGLRPPRRGG